MEKSEKLIFDKNNPNLPQNYKNMKNIVPFFTFLILMGAIFSAKTAFAQSLDNLRFGFQASPTFSWMNTNDNKINNNGSFPGVLGIKLGMRGEYLFTPNGSYALTSGIGFGFSQGGTLLHEIGGNFWSEAELSDTKFNTGIKPLPNQVNLKYNLQYLEIPLGLKMRTTDFGYFRYFVEIPVFTLGFLTQARGAIEGVGVATEKENVRGATNFFNLSWGLGGGVEYSISEKTALVMGLYYQQGFLDVTKDSGASKATLVKENMPPLENEYAVKAETSKGTLGSVVLYLGVLF